MKHIHYERLVIMAVELAPFTCDLCGQCCRMSDISLLPHEAIVLRNIAEKIGVELVFKPGYMVYDSISGFNIAFSYVMLLNNGKCPFLENNKCRIHYVFKPYICRSFPYVPRHVKYSIDDVNRYITASTEYSVSLACHIIRRDREQLEKLIHRYHSMQSIVIRYMKEEYENAVEAENTRSTLLFALSKLWRENLVDIRSQVPGAPVVNLFEFLRRFYPDLPNILRLDKIAVKVKKWLEKT